MYSTPHTLACQSICVRYNAPMHILSPKEFPYLLQHIPDPPAKLYVEGTLPNAQTKLLAVVGSRKCTSYGRDVTDFLIDGLSGFDVSIVSGLALGIDAHAHTAALRAGLHTVAVPGSGLDRSVLYPRSHVRLAEKILESGGCLLSEFEPTQAAAPWTFPKRNRIMAGMSHATLLIEAAERSGTLITARLATEYNRDLLGVPASIFADSSKGVHQFLKLGATPVTSPKDIALALGFADTEAEQTPFTLDVYSEDEQKILRLLDEPRTKDELIEALPFPISQANMLLSKLELEGVIVERGGLLRRV